LTLSHREPKGQHINENNYVNQASIYKGKNDYKMRKTIRAYLHVSK